MIAKFYTRFKQGFVIVRCTFSLYNSQRLKKETVIFPRRVRFIGIFSDIAFPGNYWEVKHNNYILYTYNFNYNN